MSVDAWIQKSDSPEQAERDAMTRSYLAARSRLTNARKALHGAIAEFEAAVHEAEQAQMRFDEYLLENPTTGDVK